MKNLVKPANGAEALAMGAILAEYHIECQIVSFHDTAYDGLFQSQYGWGIIKVSENDYTKAKEIISEWQNAAPEMN